MQIYTASPLYIFLSTLFYLDFLVCSVSLLIFFSIDTCFSCLQWISVPFALINPAVSDITVTAVKHLYQSPWIGSVQKGDTWVWIDNFCLLVL